MLKTYLCIYLVIYVTYYIINKMFDGRSDKYLRDKVYNYIAIHYGIIVPDDVKKNPVKYVINDLKNKLHDLKKGGKHKEK